MINLILYFLVIAGTMMVLSQNLPGFHVTGWGPAIIASLILAVLHGILKPILFVLSLPLIFVTLGLFLIVINAVVLWVTSLLVPGFRIDGFFPALLAAIILSLVSMLWKAITKEEKKKDA